MRSHPTGKRTDDELSKCHRERRRDQRSNFPSKEDSRLHRRLCQIRLTLLRGDPLPVPRFRVHGHPCQKRERGVQGRKYTVSLSRVIQAANLATRSAVDLSRTRPSLIPYLSTLANEGSSSTYQQLRHREKIQSGRSLLLARRYANLDVLTADSDTILGRACFAHALHRILYRR